MNKLSFDRVNRIWVWSSYVRLDKCPEYAEYLSFETGCQYTGFRTGGKIVRAVRRVPITKQPI